MDKNAKTMVEGKISQIRNEGINGGKHTLSQDISAIRYLSALINYAMPENLVIVYPC